MKENPIDISIVPQMLNLKEEPTEEITYKYGKGMGKDLPPVILKLIHLIIKPKEAKVKVFSEKKTEDRFIQKRINPENQMHKVEHFVSLLTKGIFFTSDFFKKKEIYFSKKIDLVQVNEPKKGEVEAEIFLLGYLFADWDRFPSKNHNIQIEQNNKFAHYDYGQSFRKRKHKKYLPYHLYHKKEKKRGFMKELQWQLNNIGRNLEPSSFKKNLKNILSYNMGIQTRKASEDSIDQVLKKTEEIISAIKDDIFFKAVINKSEMNLMEKPFDFLTETNQECRIKELQNALINRCNLLIELINKKKVK